jgi:LETM1 and EF-hand domain-containing protein 1
LFSQRTVSPWRPLSELRWRTNNFSPHAARRLNLNDSRYYLGYFQSDNAAFPVTDCLGHGQQRNIHTSQPWRREESKVEETLEALKVSIKQSSTAGTAAKSTAEDAAGAVEKTVVPVPVAAPVKKPLRERIVAELKHYYHGFRLLYIDVKVCARLIWQLVNGRPLMRREQKQVKFSTET